MILDVEYKPTILVEFVTTCQNLIQKEQQQLLQILQKYESLSLSLSLLNGAYVQEWDNSNSKSIVSERVNIC
jgi:hypothetical protein